MTTQFFFFSLIVVFFAIQIYQKYRNIVLIKEILSCEPCNLFHIVICDNRVYSTWTANGAELQDFYIISSGCEIWPGDLFAGHPSFRWLEINGSVELP